MLHGSVVAFDDVVKRDSRAFVLGNNKADAVGMAIGRKTRALRGVAQIAEIAQLGFSRRKFFLAGMTCPTVSGTQRQARWESPSGVGFFGRKEKGASHGEPILNHPKATAGPIM